LLTIWKAAGTSRSIPFFTLLIYLTLLFIRVRVLRDDKWRIRVRIRGASVAHPWRLHGLRDDKWRGGKTTLSSIGITFPQQGSGIIKVHPKVCDRFQCEIDGVDLRLITNAVERRFQRLLLVCLRLIMIRLVKPAPSQQLLLGETPKDSVKLGSM
jgi:hypothetical protein